MYQQLTESSGRSREPEREAMQGSTVILALDCSLGNPTVAAIGHRFLRTLKQEQMCCCFPKLTASLEFLRDDFLVGTVLAPNCSLVLASNRQDPRDTWTLTSREAVKKGFWLLLWGCKFHNLGNPPNVGRCSRIQGEPKHDYFILKKCFIIKLL